MKHSARRDRPLRRAVRGRVGHALHMFCEVLENRMLLATMDWTNASGGSWGVASNWVNAANPSDNHVPTASDTAVILALGSRVSITHSAGTGAVQSVTANAPMTWNTATAPTGGDWDTPGNWVGGVVPTASNNVIIDLTSSGTVTHSTEASDSVLSLTTNGNTRCASEVARSRSATAVRLSVP